MAGPCTLLAQPHYNRYIDATGEYVMPWAGDAAHAAYGPAWDISQSIGLSIRPHRSVTASGIPAALSTQVGFEPPNKNYLGPATLLANSSDPQTELTVVNGTKARGNSFEFNTFFPEDPALRKQFFTATEYLRWFGADSYWGKEAGYWSKITATGANLTLTRNLLAGAPNYQLLFAFVYNGNATPRTFQMIHNGVNLDAPWNIPAYTVACIGRFIGTPVALAPVGFKVTDSVNGDRFALFYMGYVQSDSVITVPRSSSFPSTAVADDLDGPYNPITTWSGTATKSIASEGEHYWRIPLKRIHIGEESGCIASRYLPVGWPYHNEAFAFNIGRQGVAAYDGTDALGEFYFETWTNSTAFEESFFLRRFGGKTDINTRSVDRYTGPVDGSVSNVNATGPATDFWTLVSSWDKGHAEWFFNGALVSEGLLDNWEGSDFPFWGIEPVGDPDPVYLSGGGSNWNWYSASAFYRDVALFNRPLTVAETAFVDDPDSVWSFNMFAEPSDATVTGLAGTLYQGDTKTLTVTIRDAAGDTVPLYGGRVSITAKLAADRRKAGDASARLRGVFECGNDGVSGVDSENVLSADPGNGAVSFSVTMPTINPGPGRPSAEDHTLVCDVQFVGVNGAVSTLLTAEFTVHIDVTNDTN